MTDLINIKTFLNRHEAELVKGFLAEKGIEAIISTDDAGGYRPHLALGGVQLLVRKEDAEKAQEAFEILERDIKENNQ